MTAQGVGGAGLAEASRLLEATAEVVSGKDQPAELEALTQVPAYSVCSCVSCPAYSCNASLLIQVPASSACSCMSCSTYSCNARWRGASFYGATWCLLELHRFGCISQLPLACSCTST